MSVHDQGIIGISPEIRLRPLVEADYELALKWYSNDNILWYSENRKEPYKMDDIQRMYRYLSGKGRVYVIEYGKDVWQPIGDVTLAEDTMPMVIVPEYQGRGIGSLIIKKLIEEGRVLGYKKMTLSGIYIYNLPSQRMYAKCGFKEVRRDDKKIYMEIELC